jgi:hypothetical protein
MATRGSSAVKIPVFDGVNYTLWKKKMLLYIKVANPKYMRVLMTGPIIPMVTEEAVTVGEVTTPGVSYEKDPALFDAKDKEEITLDDNLQLIIVDSLDSQMYNHVVNCVDAKHMWETIETINEGTVEVRENRMEILMHEYEHFQAEAEEGISAVFERYNKLINSLNLSGKFYSVREVNKKFLLTLPAHLEHRITAIRESRDINTITLEKLYGILKTYELEQEQQKDMRANRKGANTSAALYGKHPEEEDRAPKKKAAEIVRSHSTDMDQTTVELGQSAFSGKSNSEYYSLEELDQLEDQDMALVVRNFGQKFRFRRNPNHKYKSYNQFQKGSYGPTSSMSQGFKSDFMLRSKARCFNCDQLGHFASDCKKPQIQKRVTFASATQKGKPTKAYVAEGKSWDDTDSDEEEATNLALVANEDIPWSQRPRTPMSDEDKIRNMAYTLLTCQTTYARMTLEATAKDKEILELKSVHINQDKLKEQVLSLEMNVKHAGLRETYLREKVEILEKKNQAYFLSIQASKAFFNKAAVEESVGIGYDYSEALRELSNHTPIIPNIAVPHVLKDCAKTMYKKPEVEPVLFNTIVADYELHLEDQAAGKLKVLPVNTIHSRSHKNQSKFTPCKMSFESEVSTWRNPSVNQFVAIGALNDEPSTSSSITEPNKSAPKRNHNNANTTHAMPAIDLSHKACGLPRCMSCALNVMSAYFTSNHASLDKVAPRQHMNNKFAKSVRARTVSPPKFRKDTYVVVRPKTASPAMTGKMTDRPKLKQPVVKAVYKLKQPVVSNVCKLKQPAAKVYRVKCPVLVVNNIVVKNVVLPNKGQFFKYAGPNQIWVRKKV